MSSERKSPPLVAGVILAAGKSERMGRPKPLLPFGKGSTFLAHLYRLVKESSLGTVRVVLGAGARQILAEVALPPAEVVINPHYEKGMLSSIQAALRSLEEVKPDAVMVFPVDHPNISLSLIERLSAEFNSSAKEIILPTFKGRRGHPVLFGKALFGELLSAPLDVGARHVVRNNPEKILEVPTDEPGILQDIDTPDDYRQLNR